MKQGLNIEELNELQRLLAFTNYEQRRLLNIVVTN